MSNSRLGKRQTKGADHVAQEDKPVVNCRTATLYPVGTRQYERHYDQPDQQSKQKQIGQRTDKRDPDHFLIGLQKPPGFFKQEPTGAQSSNVLPV